MDLGRETARNRAQGLAHYTPPPGLPTDEPTMINEERPFPMDFDETSHFLSRPVLVYLASALTNNDQTAQVLCRQIRRAAKKAFQGYEGLRFEVYDPGDVTAPGSDHTADDVFRIDHSRVMATDVVFFHVNVGSLGVGIEAQIAAEGTIPRIFAFKKGNSVSRMFKGEFNPTICEIEYLDLDDFYRQLWDKLPEIARLVLESRRGREAVMGPIAAAKLGQEILKHRITTKTTIAELALRTDMTESWLCNLEDNDRMAASLTLTQIGRIALALGGTLAMGPEAIPTFYFVEDCGRRTHEQASLDNLAGFVMSQREEVRESIVFLLWSDYVEREQTALKNRGDDDAIYTPDDWARLYSESSRRLF